MSQPNASKNSDKRKSIGATGRSILRAISTKQEEQQVKSDSAASTAPELKSGKRPRSTQVSAAAALHTPPPSPSGKPATGTPTLNSTGSAKVGKLSRSYSAPRASKVIVSHSAPQTPRTEYELETFRPPGKIGKKAGTNTTTTNSSLAQDNSTPTFHKPSDKRKSVGVAGGNFREVNLDSVDSRTRTRMMPRSASTPKPPPEINSASAPDEFRTPSKPDTTSTTNTTSTTLSASAQLAKATTTLTTTLPPAPTSTHGTSAAQPMSPVASDPADANKRVRHTSSPDRMEGKKKEAKAEKALKRNQKAYTRWKDEAENSSSRYLAQYTAKAVLGPYLPPSADSETVKPEISSNDANPSNDANSSNSSNSSNSTKSPSNSKRNSHKLGHRHRSTHLNQDHSVVKNSALASEWISEAHYAQMPRAGQVMMVAFSAVKQLYAQGKQAFGDEWAWGSAIKDDLAPFRNWGQRGSVKRGEDNECEYFDGRENFEKLYAKGTLDSFFSGKIKEIELMVAGPERKAAILKLACHADHVLNLAQEDLSRLTLRTDIEPAMVCHYWESMSAAKPEKHDIELLTAYFGDNCITVQAYINALTWLAKTVGSCLTPPRTVREIMQTAHCFSPPLLGYTYEALENLRIKVDVESVASALSKAGITVEDISRFMKEHALSHSRVQAGKAANTRGTFDNERDNQKAKAMRLFRKKSSELMYTLTDGDQRFLQAAKVKSITDTRPAPQALESLPSTPGSAQTVQVAPMAPNSQRGAAAPVPAMAIPAIPAMPTLPQLPSLTAPVSNPKQGQLTGKQAPAQ